MNQREQILNIIKSQKGRFFTVTFIGKHDGAIHKLNGRCGVYKYSNGGYNPATGKPDLLSAFNVQKNAYRTIYLDGVVEIRAGKNVYHFAQ